ncbi:MAG: HEPN domain-containing protein [Planctomycetes bacterium]|nr:HEPN domain-containing protein [Planctomycetota bacterium]
MSAEKSQLVRSWLLKAAEDLAAARKLAADPDPLLGSAIYHCQQAAEKAVKGFLVYHDEAFEKTHDIESLITLAVRHERAFELWRATGDGLTRYATIHRYPAVIEPPEREEFEEAFKAAEGIYAFALSRLPTETHPSL